MTWIEPLALAQATPELTILMERIAWAQIVMAAVAGLFAIAAIAGAVVAYTTLRSVGRLVRDVERLLAEATPHVDPLLERAGRIADDATEISAQARRDYADVHGTVMELNQQVRRAADETDRRVREFATVLEAVQQEMQELLVDTAATARGLHTTAEVLRRPPRSERRPLRIDDPNE